MKDKKLFFQAKTYATRDGRMARIYALDGGGAWPLHGAIFNGSEWIPVHWTEQGHIDSDKSEPGGDLDGLWEDRPRRMIAWTYLEHQQIRSMLTGFCGNAVDFGCGYGRNLPVLMEFAAHVTGVERDPKLAALAEQCWPRATVRNVPSLADTGLIDGLADLLLSFTVLQHLTDAELDSAAKEILRITKPSALILLCEESDPTHHNGTWGRSPEEYARILKCWVLKRRVRIITDTLASGWFVLLQRNAV